MDSFEDIVNSIKSAKVCVKHDNGYKKSIVRIIEKQKNLINLLKKIYDEHSVSRNTFCSFVENIVTHIENGKLLKISNDSIHNYLKYYLFQYSNFSVETKNCFAIDAKQVSIDIMNDYNAFLFIVKLLDNDIMFTAVVKFLLNALNHKLLQKKIFIKPFKE